MTVVKLRRSCLTLALAGLVVVGIGVYFALFRPDLLPEDERDPGASLAHVTA